MEQGPAGRIVTATRHEKMIEAAVWLSRAGAFIGWGDLKDGKAVNRPWKSDMARDEATIRAMLARRDRNSVVVPSGRLVNVDIDRFGWAEKCEAAGMPPATATFTVETPTKRRQSDSKPLNGDDPDATPWFHGRQVYGLAPEGYDVTAIPGAWAGGETRRSENGEQNMVLGPWSLRKDGVYTPMEGTARSLAVFPVEFLDWLLIEARDDEGGGVRKPPKDDDWTWDDAMGSRHDHIKGRMRFWAGMGVHGEALISTAKAYIARHVIPDTPRAGDPDPALGDEEITRLAAWADKTIADDRPNPTITLSGPDGVTIDPLDVGTRTMAPVTPLAVNDLWLPSGLVGLMAHLERLGDAPLSSLLLASMTTMSALAGPTPSLNWRGRNRASIFGVLVGDANYGRKGQAMRLVETAFSQVDPVLREITRSGIASPEKLIDLLVESKTTTIGSMLIRQMELSTVLTIAQREGNNMSSILREVWDGDDVQTHSRMKGSTIARDYHVALLAGTNPKDLAAKLSGDDLVNGWANRFLWFWAEKDARTFADTADDTLEPSLAKWLMGCIDLARTLGGSALIAPRYTMELSPDAADHLRSVVAALDVRPRGWIDGLRQRMPAHVVRLAMVSALFDKRRIVTIDDVGLGEAITAYAVDSTRAVFGTRVDDPVAGLVLSVLAQAPDGWLNTSTLARACRVSGDRVNRALGMLVDGLLIAREVRPTAGRPAVGYRLL